MNAWWRHSDFPIDAVKWEFAKVVNDNKDKPQPDTAAVALK